MRVHTHELLQDGVHNVLADHGHLEELGNKEKVWGGGKEQEKSATEKSSSRSGEQWTQLAT